MSAPKLNPREVQVLAFLATGSEDYGCFGFALTPPASNGCACSATALSLYKQHMRSALWQLGLHYEAPRQRSLFE